MSKKKTSKTKSGLKETRAALKGAPRKRLTSKDKPSYAMEAALAAVEAMNSPKKH